MKSETVKEMISHLEDEVSYHLLEMGKCVTAIEALKAINGQPVMITPVTKRKYTKRAVKSSGAGVKGIKHKKQFGKLQVGKVIRDWIKNNGQMTREQIYNQLITDYSSVTVKKYRKKIASALGMLVYLPSGGVKVKKDSASKWNDLYSLK